MIKTLDQMVEKVLSLNKQHRIVVAWAQDPNTIGAISKAVSNGFIKAIMIGIQERIREVCMRSGIDPDIFNIIDSPDDVEASSEAVRLVKSGQADIIMKGLVSTDKFLKPVMDKDNGIMSPGAVLTHVGAIEVPAYHKLLFITDPAVIPFPDLGQKVAMVRYAVEMARKFGIEKPKIALISASEKVSRHFPSSEDYQEICRMAEHGEIKNCTVDGPLDIFLACDKKSLEIKGIDTPVGGDADILLFPSLESCNPFYKGLMLFAGGELAGLIRGTEKPVVLMSRNESEESKFYSIALSCLMSSD
jgi:phosphate butyryltransferase